MRVPSIGPALYERRIVREGKRMAAAMLENYTVTANGRFIRSTFRQTALPAWLAEALARAGFRRDAANGK